MTAQGCGLQVLWASTFWAITHLRARACSCWGSPPAWAVSTCPTRKARMETSWIQATKKKNGKKRKVNLAYPKTQFIVCSVSCECFINVLKGVLFMVYQNETSLEERLEDMEAERAFAQNRAKYLLERIEKNLASGEDYRKALEEHGPYGAMGWLLGALRIATKEARKLALLV